MKTITRIALVAIVVSLIHDCVSSCDKSIRSSMIKGKVTYTDAPAAEVAADEVLLPAINPIPSSTPAPAAERP